MQESRLLLPSLERARLRQPPGSSYGFRSFDSVKTSPSFILGSRPWLVYVEITFLHIYIIPYVYQYKQWISKLE